MTDEPRNEFHDLAEYSAQYHKPPIGSVVYGQTAYIEGEFAPCTDEEFNAGLQAQGWRPAPYLKVEDGRVIEVDPTE